MAKFIDLQNVMSDIINGTFDNKYCRICLEPLNDLYEDVFTTVCKENSQYCMAEVLEEVFNMKIAYNDNFKVCPGCFISTSEIYKFYQITKRNEEILNHCMDKLNRKIKFLELPKNLTSLYVILPKFTSNYDYDIDLSQFSFKKLEDLQKCHESDDKGIREVEFESDFEDNLLILAKEDNATKFLRSSKNRALSPVVNNVNKSDVTERTRKRNRLVYKNCSHCPTKYRSVSKLKEHMKQAHGVDLNVCMVCQETIEDEEEFKTHQETHKDARTCNICDTTFKNKDNKLEHQKCHESMKSLSENNHICEVCGLLFESEELLKEHHEAKHVNKYTCFYCGKMYKEELSFEIHVRKHKMNLDTDKKEKAKTKKRTYKCETCDKNFTNKRSLLWHERLHKDERPYVCNVCGRGFVSVNRRNVHAKCVHMAPTRRCPLCPALFHLRSRVFTHMRLVHLITHEHPQSTVKQQNMFWKMEPDSIQELGVALENDILDLQTKQKDANSRNKSVCQETIEDKEEFKDHQETHKDAHTCNICNTAFKNKDNMLEHLKSHVRMWSGVEMKSYISICEVCGLLFESEELLKDHHEAKHVNKYTCFYCGKMYKAVQSFECHVRKHEMNMDTVKEDKRKTMKGTYLCETCGKNFVNARALLWHERLHKDERPYVCDVCGRGFVSKNRRNQHATCAHTAPTRRCPLCPALFHLRSMVNTHIRKVHLKAHKRRHSTVKRQNVLWKTLLDLQAKQKEVNSGIKS